ncbi:MAG: NAD-dependent epimerase/dehydratase family protein [Flavobacteriales bacterium]|nr:NAD-dependent epimerase/dehydratase family protein [Flavobacteriales bacterium]
MEQIKILVTGGAGNVGGALARRLVENPKYYVVIADNLSTGSREKLPSSDYKNWSFVACDVNDYRDISELMMAYKFDYVFHYAAVVGVKRTQDNPIMVLNDIDGIKNVLNLSKNTSVKRTFFSSSSEVYGEPVELPQHEETTPLNSRVPYAVVKNVGEAFFRSFKKSYGLDFTIFRFFNTYGPNQSKDFVVSKFLSLALQNKDITIYGDGSQTRTFCYVDDNVDACIKIFEEEHEMNDVINIGGAEEMTILELAQLVIRKTNSTSNIIHLPPLPEGDMSRRMPDNSKMIKILNRPLLSIEEGIEKMLAHPEFKPE